MIKPTLPATRRNNHGTARENLARTARGAWPVLALTGLLVFLPAAASAQPVPGQTGAANATRPAIVFVPGVTGTRLENPATGEVLWGDAAQLLGPKDRGYSTVLPLTQKPEARNAFVPSGLLSHMRLLTYTREIYRPLQRFLESLGHEPGSIATPTAAADLYSFTYDWRRENWIAARDLHLALTEVAQARGDRRVRLLCQSNAGRICRFVAKYGGASANELWAARDNPEAIADLVGQPLYRIELVVLIGNSHGGALRQLHELHKGRKYVPGIGRFMGGESLFALRTLFEDLPFYRDDLFLDLEGVPLEIDLFDPESWRRYQWSVFRPEIAERLDSPEAQRLFGSAQDRLSYLALRLKDARQGNALLMSDAPLDAPNICLLQNITANTIERAVVHYSQRKKRWQLLFDGDRGVPRALRKKLTSPGDGHGTETSQNYLSSQELAAVAATHRIEGGHFDAITKKPTLERLRDCLQQQDSR